MQPALPAPCPAGSSARPGRGPRRPRAQEAAPRGAWPPHPVACGACGSAAAATASRLRSLAGGAASRRAGGPRRRRTALGSWGDGNFEDAGRDGWSPGEPLGPPGQLPEKFCAGGAAGGKVLRILCYGDSLTVGFCAGGSRCEPYGRSLAVAVAEATGHATEVEVCGHCGHSTDQMFKNLDSDHVIDVCGAIGKGLRRIASEAKPRHDLVIISAGTTDVAQTSRHPDDILDNLRAFHEVRGPGSPTLALAPLECPQHLQSRLLSSRRNRVARLLEWWARDLTSGPGVTFVDPAGLVPATVADGADGVWDWDGVHLAPRGSSLLGRCLSPAAVRSLPATARPAASKVKKSAADVAAVIMQELADLQQTASVMAALEGREQHDQCGLEIWRSLDPEEAKTFLGDVQDDFARGMLAQGVPLHSAALLFLQPEAVPCVGQEVEMRLEQESGMPSIHAVEWAAERSGGIMACVPLIEGAIGIPHGGTLVEILDFVRFGDAGDALIRLRAVSSARLVMRQPADKVSDFTVALFQEVAEWGPTEEQAGLQAIAREAKAVSDLFLECRQLQDRSGYMAAGDFVSAPLPAHTRRALDVLRGVRLLHVGRPLEPEAEPVVRGACATAHAAVGALSVTMRTKFLCDPVSVLTRLERIREFLSKVSTLLCSKLAIDKAMNDDD
ncbi:unnamed protein product [Prorocentrum cordatum]|uniref:SGNH hydrolase-type esterase domain-containing protein n=1 Tax=Prorocentrum cordatum TaxID=2364126 RepID=A0ABN9XIQ7_9DINO|nr:unnamed protein product [Polarella glacialis]